MAITRSKSQVVVIGIASGIAAPLAAFSLLVLWHDRNNLNGGGAGFDAVGRSVIALLIGFFLVGAVATAAFAYTRRVFWLAATWSALGYLCDAIAGAFVLDDVAVVVVSFVFLPLFACAGGAGGVAGMRLRGLFESGVRAGRRQHPS